ncbi:MAG: response regulator [Phycisphaerae bacterium]|nr:response regulator [Phycisphaerae bacterium]
MARQSGFKSVRTRQAFWLLIVAMTPLIIVVTTLYYQRSAVIRGREFEKLRTIRDLKVRELNHWLDERIGDLEIAAGDREICGLEKTLAKEPAQRTQEDLAAMATARGLLQRYVDSYDAYREIFIVCTHSGKVDVSSEKSREGRDKRKDLYYTEPLRTKSTYIKDIYQSKTEGVPTMSFSTPVRCLEHDGEHIIAILVARIDLEHSLYPLLQEHTGFGKTGCTVVVNKDGIALNDLRLRENAALRLKITAESAVKAAAGDTGITETRDYRGEMVLAAYTHIPRTGWGFVTKRDLSEIYTPIQAMVRDMAIILVVSAVAVLGVAMLLSRTISRPILDISETVRRVAEGDLDARYRGAGSDEIAALGASFNNMTDSLASQRTVLQGAADIAETMSAAGDVETFASDLLMKLMDVTSSQLGAFYTRSEDDSIFESVKSVGLAADAAPFFSADEYEGEFGRALATGETTYIRDIPESTVFTFKTTAGTAIPGEVVTIPLVVEGKVMAVISLGTLTAYSFNHCTILTQAQIGMNTALANALSGAQTSKLAEELRAGNEELASVNEELQTRSEELEQQAQELELQRRQVEEANRLKSEFLSNMSHELRTPLNSVLSLSQLMLSRGTGKNIDEEAEFLTVIERNGRGLLNLINDVLDLSRIEAGQAEILPADVSAADVTEAALSTTRPLIDEKQLTLRVNIADNLPTLHTDEGKVRQILLNLLSNAVKFTDTGEVSVAVRLDGDCVSFAVGDSGVGISAEDQKRIFDEFRQVDGSTTRKYGGTGLGLAISRRLAELLGGDVEVNSEPGKGSTFTLRLPVRLPEGLGATPQPAPGPMIQPMPQHSPLNSGKTLRVLVVEDNEVAALQIRTALGERGYDVTVANDGAEALDAIAKSIPDGIVLDLMIPNIDGFAVLEEIRSTPATARIPVLVLTAKELTAADRARLTQNNIQQLIQKGSVDRDELVAEIDRLLGTQAPGEAAEEAGDAEPFDPPDLSGKTILVVEDNPDNLLVTTALLTEMGAETVTASDGQAGLDQTRQTRPDLVLLDIQLPILSGMDVATQIKADDELKNIPVIALTAKVMKGDREQILAAGCDDYLSKPLNPPELWRVLRKWLD